MRRNKKNRKKNRNKKKKRPKKMEGMSEQQGTQGSNQPTNQPTYSGGFCTETSRTVPRQDTEPPSGTENSVLDRSADVPRQSACLGTCIAICAFGAVIYILKGRQGSTSPLLQVTCRSPECQELYATPTWLVDGHVRPCDDFHAYVCGNWIRDREKKSFMAESLDLHVKFVHNTVKTLRTHTLTENLQEAAETGRALLSACLAHMASRRLDLKRDVTLIFRKLNLSQVLEQTSSLGAISAGAEISFRFNLNGLVRLRPQKARSTALLYALPGFSLKDALPLEAVLEPYIKAVVRATLRTREYAQLSAKILATDNSVVKVQGEGESPPKVIAASEMLLQPSGLIAAVNGSLEKFVRRCNLRRALVVVRSYDVTVKLLHAFQNTSVENSSWYIVVQLLTDLLQFDYVKRFDGAVNVTAQKTCLSSTNDALSPRWSLLMRSLTHNSSHDKEVGPVNRLFHNIKKSLVDNNSFLMTALNDSTSSRVQEVIDAITYVSSQDLIDETEKIVLEKSLLVLPGTGFLDDHITVREEARRLSQFSPPNFLLDVSSGFEFETKPFFVREHSSFIVPFALEAPHVYYNRGQLRFLNYGTLGVIMAQELTKVVTPGATFNYSEPIWSPEATRRYESTMSCYAGFHGSSRSWASTGSGELQLELFVWLTSLRVAYDALMKDEGAHTESFQREFFLRFCLAICGSTRTSALTARQKCLWPLFDMPEFSAAFKCSNSTFMASQHKCHGST